MFVGAYMLRTQHVMLLHPMLASLLYLLYHPMLASQHVILLRKQGQKQCMESKGEAIVRTLL